MKKKLNDYYFSKEFDIDFELNKILVVNLNEKYEDLKYKYKKLIDKKIKEKMLLDFGAFDCSY